MLKKPNDGLVEETQEPTERVLNGQSWHNLGNKINDILDVIQRIK